MNTGLNYALVYVLALIVSISRFVHFFHSKTGRISLVKSAKTVAVKMTKRIVIVIMINTKIKDKNSKHTYHIMRFSRSIGS